MATTDMTFDEMIDSLSGYDELGIKQLVQTPLSKLLQADELHATRCLVAVHLNREAGGQGSKDLKKAYEQALGLSFKEVRTYFAEPVEEFDPSDPDSESGKDD